MKEYKRLTNKKATSENTKPCYDNNGNIVMDKELFELLIKEHNQLWELENQIENGTLIELPCKVGTKVYYAADLTISKFFKTTTVYDIVEMYFTLDMLGTYQNCWFLTKAEAEQKLKELQNERLENT